MRKLKKTAKQSLSLFLCLIMVVGMLQVTAFADEPGDANPGVDTGAVSDPSDTEDTSGQEEGDTDADDDTPEEPSEPEHDTSYSDTQTKTDEVTGETTTTTTSGWRDVDNSDPDKKVVSSEEKVETTVTDRDGNTLEDSGSVKGESTTTTTETTEKKEPGAPEDEQGPTVDVTPGDTTTAETPGEFKPTGTTPESSETEKVKGDLPYTGDITVTLKPGENQTVTKPLTDQQLADLLFEKDSDYPLNEMLSEPKVETNDDGDTVTTSTTQEDGKFIKTVITEKQDGTKVEEKTTVELKGSDNGKGGKNVTEFVITTVTTTIRPSETGEPVVEEVEDSRTHESKTDTTYEVPEDKVTITLPEKPEASDSTADDGTRTVVTVEEILDEEGTVVGYQTTTTKTSADGKQTSSESESVWGTKTTVSTKIQKDTTTTTDSWTVKGTTTTTTLITQGTTVNGHKITATDRELWASMSKVKPGKDHGQVTMTPSVTPGIVEPGVGKTDTATDLYHRADATFEEKYIKTENGKNIYQLTFKKDEKTWTADVIKDGNNTYKAYGSDFQWLGEYGLESAIRVNTREDGMGTWQPHQFVLVDKEGKEFYVYCADFEVNPKGGATYDMTNIEDADYYKTSKAAEHIRYIVENGYWGTTGDKDVTGSLEAVKELMRQSNKFTEEEINNLTSGEALTATQAAIWHFGNSGKTDVGTTYKNIVGNYNTNGYVAGKDYKTPADKKALTQKLYEFLIEGQTKAPDDTVLITEKNFATSATITVKDKVTETDSDGNTGFKMTTDNKAIYNADVSFGMSVTPSQHGDLLVHVIVDGEIIETKRLAGENKEGQNYGKIIPDKNGNYTIPGLELPNGSTVTLNLSGTQGLAKGVYLYTCSTGHEGSQTFVGMGEGTRKVDLSVDVNFSVKEPEATITKTESGNTQEKTDTVTETRKDQITQKQVTAEITIYTTTTTEEHTEWGDSWHNDYRPDEGDDDTDDDDVDTGDDDTDDDDVDTGDDDTDTDDDTDIPDEPTPLAPRPEEEVDISDENVPLANLPEEEVEILDEDVPLAVAPETGDISMVWYAMIGVSAAGLVCLNLRKKQDED